MSEQCTCAQNTTDPQGIHSFPLAATNMIKREAREFAMRASGLRVSAFPPDDFDEDDGTVLTTNDGSFFVSGSLSHEAAMKAGAASGSVAVYGTTSTGVGALALSNVKYDEAKQELALKFSGLIGTTPVDNAVRLKVNDNSAAFVSSADSMTASAPAAGLPSPICIIRCGGSAILPLVVANLPILISGGPAAFIAALLASAPAKLIGVINCIRTQCL